jgi:Acylamino-acid-releasing enzyme, N-terminal domain
MILRREFSLDAICAPGTPVDTWNCQFQVRLALQEDWGELNTGKKPPALFVLDLASWRAVPVSGLPQDSSAGQPVWTPKGVRAPL